MRLNILGNKDCYVTDEVSTIPTALANLTEETRIKFVTDLAAVSRGKSSSKNPTTRYVNLLTEAAPNNVDNYDGNPSRPLEFLPIVATFELVKDEYGDSYVYLRNNKGNIISDTCMALNWFNNMVLRFSYTYRYYNGVYEILTNMRTMLIAGICRIDVPYMPYVTYRVYKEEDNKEYIMLSGNKVYLDNIKYKHSVNCTTNDVHIDSKELLEDVSLDSIIKDYNNKHADGYLWYSSFKALKLSIPMFVWAQWPMTHTRLSKESQSDRVAENNNYWLPSNIVDKILNIDIELLHPSLQEIIITIKANLKLDTSTEEKHKYLIDIFTKVEPQYIVQKILKEAGYRREIWSRAPYYFKLKEVVVTGWYTDPTTWEHSLIERGAYPEVWKNWTQKETKEVILGVKKVLGV